MELRRNNYRQSIGGGSSQDSYAEPDSNSPTFKNIFVTVGTTSFDPLIDTLLRSETIDQMIIWGTQNVRIQMGSTRTRDLTIKEIKRSGIIFKFYQFKPNLKADMEWADLIISHAGAGSTLDALDAYKTLLVVPNEELMDNHQLELANHLVKKRYAYSATLSDFHLIASTIKSNYLRKYSPKDSKIFQNFVLKTLNIID